MSPIETIKGTHPELNIPFEAVPWSELYKLVPAMLSLPEPWTGPHNEPDNVDGVYCLFEPKWGKRYKVLISCARECDGQLWIHLSMSKWSQSGKEQLTVEWQDLWKIKELFLPTREAYMVFPTGAALVDKGNVYHFWAAVDGPALPDFTQGTRSI